MNNIQSSAWPSLGCGLGLRKEHYKQVTTEWPEMDWFEVISENFMDSRGRPFEYLQKVRSRYPVALHGVSLSIGSSDPLNETYLRRLKDLAEVIEPAIVSDHLCWTGVDGENLHDLLPMPFTKEAAEHVASRASAVQEYLGRRILLENVSSYVLFGQSEMTEWEFLAAVAEKSGCGILLDLNNIYVNAHNHGFDAMTYLRGIPPAAVGQFHLAGHSNMGTFLFDTHGAPIIDTVWNLYGEALKIFGPVSTLIERDENVPSYEELSREALFARRMQNSFKTPAAHV